MDFGFPVTVERVCRYGCPDPTHVCQECLNGASHFSGYYCERHAIRHDALVKDAGGSVFCKPIEQEQTNGTNSR